MSMEPEITMKNTKAEMLEALNAALFRAEALALETKVEGITTLIESEKKAAADSAIAELTREHEYKTALSDKDYQSSLARQNDKIAYLEKELESEGKTNATLQNKLDKAYTELRELATKTVESASGVKIIGGSGE